MKRVLSTITTIVVPVVALYTIITVAPLHLTNTLLLLLLSPSLLLVAITTTIAPTPITLDN